MKLSRRAVSLHLTSSAVSFYLSPNLCSTEARAQSTDPLETEFWKSHLAQRYYDLAQIGRSLFKNGITEKTQEYYYDIFVDALIYTGDYKSAEAALEAKAKYYSDSVENYDETRVGAIIEIQKADIYRARSEWDDAEVLYKSSIRKIQKAFGGISDNLTEGFSDLPQYFVRACNGLALLKIQSRQISQAKKLFRRSVQVAVNRPNTMDKMMGFNTIPLAATYLQLGQSLYQIGEYEEAIVIVEEAIKLLQSISGLNPAYAAQYHLLNAKAKASKLEYNGAAREFELAIASAKLDQMNFGAVLIQSLMEYWRFKKTVGDTGEQLAREAVHAAEKLYGIGSLPAARCSLEYFELSEEALLAAPIETLEELVVTLTEYYSARSAEVLRAKLILVRHLIETRQFIKAIEITNSIGLTDAVQTADYLFVMSKLPMSPEVFEKAFAAAQLISSNTVEKSVVEYMSRSLIADPTGQELLRSYQNQKALVERHFSNLSAFGASANIARDKSSEFQALTDVISREELKLRDLEESLRQKHPEYFEFIKSSYVSGAELQQYLNEGEALILIHADSALGRSYIWCVTKSSKEWQQIDATQQEIDKIAMRLRTQSMPESVSPFDLTLSHRLYQLTVGRMKSVLEKKSNILFVLNGALASLPPHVLITGDPAGKTPQNADWLIKSVAVTILPTVYSLKLLRKTRSTKAPQKPMRAYAAISYSPREVISNSAVEQRELSQLFSEGVAVTDLLAQASPLPATGPEVLAVMSTLGGSEDDIISGRMATETNVKEADLSDYRVLYFATHGLLAGEVEEFARLKAEPALLFAVPEAPSAEDDGLLTASEITQLKINADWVVLSACNTASGGKPGGPALSGLAQAFLHAGSGALLVSHWPVDDEATKVLMIRLFQHLNTPQLSGAEALRLAILDVMNDADHPDWISPTYWAPFIVVGEPRTIAA
jgi:CHAT domain-containing protein